MKTSLLSAFFLSLSALTSAHAYDCSVTAFSSPATSAIPAEIVGTRVLSIEGLGTEVGGIAGENFITESKKSSVSFNSLFSSTANEQQLKLKFTRFLKAKRTDVNGEPEFLGEIAIQGSESKIVTLDGGRYKVVVICANRK